MNKAISFKLFVMNTLGLLVLALLQFLIELLLVLVILNHSAMLSKPSGFNDFT
jgi:hypothetical protein